MPGYFYFARFPTLAIFPSPRRDISPGNLRVANGVHNEAEMAWRADGPGICLPFLPSLPLVLLSFVLACLLAYLLTRDPLLIFRVTAILPRMISL